MCFFASFWALLASSVIKYINKGWIKPYQPGRIALSGDIGPGS